MRTRAIVVGDRARGASLPSELAAQGSRPPASRRAVDRRHGASKARRPVSNDVLKVKLPKPQEATLANGLRLMVLEDHRLPRVSFQIIVPGAGGYYDPAADDRPERLRRADDARGHEVEIVAADLAGARDDGGQRQRRRRHVRHDRRRCPAAR